jgi:hypothetical protein
VWWIFTTQQQEIETRLEYFVVDIWFFFLFEKEEGIYLFIQISTTSLGRISNIEIGTIHSSGKDMQALANWCFKTTKCFEKDYATSL